MELAASLTPAIAAISGGVGDIGGATAILLARSGADIAVGDLAEPAKAEPLRAEIEKCERRFFYRSLDVADPIATETWYRDVRNTFGRSPNLIIPSAAIFTSKRLGVLSPDEWRKEIDINLNGAFYFSHFGAKGLVAEKKPGRIVFIGSWAGHAVHRDIPAYCVSKAALRMLCKNLAAELADKEILVNEVAPGYVDAGLSGRVFKEHPSRKESARKAVPIGRLIAAEEVARQVLLFCGETGNQITGTVCLMDGGLSLLQGPQFET